MEFICYMANTFFSLSFIDLSLVVRARACVYVRACVRAGGYVHTSAGELRSQKRVCMLGKHGSTHLPRTGITRLLNDFCTF